ncbi:hypothetical protein YB2330_002426 [Saitoella coloradoensis]
MFGSPVELHHALETASLHNPDSTSTTTLSALVESLPSLKKPFRSTPWLFNGHLQTIYAALGNFEDIDRVEYARYLYPLSDGGTSGIDFVLDDEAEGGSHPELPPRTRFTTEDERHLTSDDSRPMLVALHGLSGGSHESYVRAVLAEITKEEVGGQRWAACVMNARGCALTKVTSPQFMNACWTEDIRQVMLFLRQRYPNRRFYGVGFSLGASILANYLGEEGPNSPFTAATVLSCPWDLQAGNLHLQRTHLGLEIYSRAMCKNLQRLFEIHLPTFSLSPHMPPHQIERVRKARYLHEFDAACTSKMFEYPTVTTYYRDASSARKVLNVRTPLFVLHALDDPIAPGEALPWEEVKVNPYVVMATTATGGHLTWYETWAPASASGRRWFVRPVVEFFNAVEEGKWEVREDKKAV